MEHTKGEWEVHDKMTETRSELEIIPVYNCPKEGRMLHSTRCICAVTGHDKEAEANAKLIAAAPDLLEACKLAMTVIPAQQAALTAIIKGVTEKTELKLSTPDLPPMDIFEAAIAKATD